MSSLVFSKEGEGFYLHSSSEYQRFTVSASKVTLPKCTVKIVNDEQMSVEEEVIFFIIFVDSLQLKNLT